MWLGAGVESLTRERIVDSYATRCNSQNFEGIDLEISN